MAKLAKEKEDRWPYVNMLLYSDTGIFAIGFDRKFFEIEGVCGRGYLIFYI